jgi:sugar phosphate isomerase/epimerase
MVVLKKLEGGCLMRICKVSKKLLVLGLISTVLLMASYGFAENKLVFKKYPNLKLGFTTVLFAKCGMDASVENAITFIDLASEMGFCWIELRDSNGNLKCNECKAINAYAKAKSIEVVYAGPARGPLDPDFTQILKKNQENTVAFTEGPRVVRMAETNTEFVKDPNKKAWTDDEFNQAVTVFNSAANSVKAAGLQMVIENGKLPFKGQFGLDELMDKANPALGFQLDTANMFIISRVKPTPKDAEQVIAKLAPRIVYTHLKSSVNGVAQLVLTDNEISFDIVFETLNKFKKNYIAIELAQPNTYKEAEDNLTKSLEYLRNKGYLK